MITLKSILNESNKLITKKGPDIFYHGTSHKIKNFRFPMWITTSKSRASMFSVSMKYDPKKGRNKFSSLDGTEKGYVYTIELKNYKIIKKNYDEHILYDAESLQIKHIDEVGVKKSSVFRRDWDYYIKK